MGADDDARRDGGRAVFGTRLEAAQEALARRCPADALQALDGLEGEDAEAVRRLRIEAWRQVGSVRGLARLGVSREEAAFGEGEIPCAAAPEALSDALAQAGRDGRAGDAARLHLALADGAARVDLRFGHVEAAAALAEVLDDPRLRLLVEAFEARLDADVGDDEDAIARAEAVLADATPEASPLACCLAWRVRAEVVGRLEDAAPERRREAREAADRAPEWGGARWGIGARTG